MKIPHGESIPLLHLTIRFRLSCLCCIRLVGGFEGVGMLLVGFPWDDQPPSAGKVTPLAEAKCPAGGDTGDKHSKEAHRG